MLRIKCLLCYRRNPLSLSSPSFPSVPSSLLNSFDTPVPSSPLFPQSTPAMPSVESPLPPRPKSRPTTRPPANPRLSPQSAEPPSACSCIFCVECHCTSRIRGAMRGANSMTTCVSGPSLKSQLFSMYFCTEKSSGIV